MTMTVNQELTTDPAGLTDRQLAEAALAEVRALRAELAEVSAFVAELRPLLAAFGGMADKMAKGGPAALLSLLRPSGT